MRNLLKTVPCLLALWLFAACSKTSTEPIIPEPENPSGSICFFNDDGNATSLTTMNFDGTESKVILEDNTGGLSSIQSEWTKWSFDKSKILFTSNRDNSNTFYLDIYMINKDGTGITRITHTDSRGENCPSLSPDGKTLLYTAGDLNGNEQLFTSNADGTNEKQLTSFTRSNRKVYCATPAWSYDGSTIYFNANRDTTAFNIYSIKADGTNLKRLSSPTGPSEWGVSVSRTGKLVFYSTVNSVPCLFTMNADGSNRKQVTSIYSGDPVWSPDGNYIAFISNKDKTSSSDGEDIYTIKADGTELKRLTSTNGSKWFIDWK